MAIDLSIRCALRLSPGRRRSVCSRSPAGATLNARIQLAKTLPRRRRSANSMVIVILTEHSACLATHRILPFIRHRRGYHAPRYTIFDRERSHPNRSIQAIQPSPSALSDHRPSRLGHSRGHPYNLPSIVEMPALRRLRRSLRMRNATRDGYEVSLALLQQQAHEPDETVSWLEQYTASKDPAKEISVQRYQAKAITRQANISHPSDKAI